jgi:hypothetical protein
MRTVRLRAGGPHPEHLVPGRAEATLAGLEEALEDLAGLEA